MNKTGRPKIQTYHSFIYSVNHCIISQMFTEHLLCMRHCARCRRYVKIDMVPIFMDLITNSDGFYFVAYREGVYV